MGDRDRLRLAGTAAALLLGLTPAPAGAQAFTAPKGLGSVTLAWQWVGNTGHIFTDGYFQQGSESVSTSLLLEAEYAVTDRFSASIGLPYVFARYTGDEAPFSRLPSDECRCWQSSFQDVALSARYRLGGDTWAVTPLARLAIPTHDYPFVGEAVVGRNLREAQVGVAAAVKLDFLPRATLQHTYTYAFVESPLDDIAINRSNGSFDLGYAATRRLYARAAASWQRSHGGLRAGSVTGNPFPLPGELAGRGFGQRDRVLRTHWWQLGGGLAWSAGPADVFASYAKYVWGRDSHNAHVFGAGATWYFGLPD